jgi:hypothetical protein
MIREKYTAQGRGEAGRKMASSTPVQKPEPRHTESWGARARIADVEPSHKSRGAVAAVRVRTRVWTTRSSGWSR